MVGRVLALVLVAGCSFESGTLPGAAAGTDGGNPRGSDASAGDASQGSDAQSVTGSISISVQKLGSADLDLTSEGTIDWAHWGVVDASSFTHKQGGTSISDLATTPALRFTGAPFTASWTDGTPQSTASKTTTGVAVNQGSNMEFTVAAGTASHTLRVYVGAQLASAQLDVSLSDSSATALPQTKTSSNSTTNYQYTIVYNAASDGQTLTVRWTDTSDFSNQNQAFAALLEATLQ